MNRVLLRAEEITIATSFFGKRIARGFEVPEQSLRLYLEQFGELFFETWEERHFFSKADENGNRVFNEEINLMLHVIGDPTAGMICKNEFDDTYQWGIYLKADSIVLVIRDEKDLFLLCWVPVISLALGSLYGVLEELFLTDENNKVCLNCGFFSGEQYDMTMLMKTADEQYLYVTDEDDEDADSEVISLKDAFDRLTLRIVKAHGKCIKEA